MGEAEDDSCWMRLGRSSGGLDSQPGIHLRPLGIAALAHRQPEIDSTRLRENNMDTKHKAASTANRRNGWAGQQGTDDFARLSGSVVNGRWEEHRQ
jgi:hypothetical protein